MSEPNGTIGFMELDVGIRWTEDRDPWTIQNEIDVIVGYQSHSSGAGFGFRDLQYAVSRRHSKELVREIQDMLDHEEDYVSCYYVPPNFVWRLRDWWEER